MSSATARPVVVGVDGSGASLASIAMAVREAALRRRPLRLVHADSWVSGPAWLDAGPVEPEAVDPRADPEQIVKEAAEHAAAFAGVSVQAEVVPGDPGAVLVRESRTAELVIVCHRGAGGFLGLRMGSVAIKVAAYARCPVLVVRGTPAPGGIILAGIDPSAPGARATGFAFRAAALRGAELVALHARPGDPTGADPAREEEGLAAALKGWTDRYPQVPIRCEVRRGRAAGALVAASERAQLVVVGTRGPGRRPTLPFGSVTHALLHHAACPVAVVPPTR
jgi:nucleotide-binding universal stress UspA family protein